MSNTLYLACHTSMGCEELGKLGSMYYMNVNKTKSTTKIINLELCIK
jgi:hypothetical protein